MIKLSFSCLSPVIYSGFILPLLLSGEAIFDLQSITKLKGGWGLSSCFLFFVFYYRTLLGICLYHIGSIMRHINFDMWKFYENLKMTSVHLMQFCQFVVLTCYLWCFARVSTCVLFWVIYLFIFVLSGVILGSGHLCICIL